MRFMFISQSHVLAPPNPKLPNFSPKKLFIISCITLVKIIITKSEITDSIEPSISSDDIIDGGLLPFNKQLTFRCESSREHDDSLVSSSFNSDGNTFCSNSKREKGLYNQRAQDLLEEIATKEKLYLKRLSEKIEENPPEGKDGDCSFYTNLISEDLRPFASGVSKEMTDAASTRGVLYQILGGKVFREQECNFPNRCSGIEHFLTEVAKDLPDTEFVVNISDWPQIPAWSKAKLPVFSFSKTADYSDITYPAWTFWEGGPAISIYPKGIGRWDLIRKSLISTAKKISWEKKKAVGFFRGSRTSSERDPLVLLSRKYPYLVDAQYTKNQAWKSDRDTLNAPAAPEVSFEGHCEYKYLFNYRGVAASFRFKHLFLCNSLVFHVGEEWTEFFYPVLIPWIHYVPVEKSSKEEDLRFLIEFFKANDGIASRIASRGYNFIANNLKLSHVLCYWKELLASYTKLITYDVEKRMDMIPIS